MARLEALGPRRRRALRDEGSTTALRIGDSAADLFYTPVPPCRTFDTRSSGGIIAAGTERNFYVAGGCDIPYGPATAVLINLTAVDPAATGNLKAWAVGNPQTAAPSAAIMTYSTATNPVSNAVLVPICDPAQTSCTAGDIRIRVGVASTHVVGDVMGYYRKVDMPVGSAQITSVSTVASGYYMGATQVAPLQNVSCLVTCTVDWSSATANTTGYLGVKPARRIVSSVSDSVAAVWYNEAARPATNAGSSSAAQVGTFELTAGTAYQFGCHVNASGDFTSDILFPTVAWICR